MLHNQSASSIALQLEESQFIQVEIDESTAILSDGSHQIKLEGLFAEAMFSLINHEFDKKHLLQHIENTHTWLSGLSQATVIQKTDADILLGKGLGMLFVEVTSRCNERCIHCYADSSPERNDFLSLEQIKSVLEEAQILGNPFIQFTGGDPLIHPDIVEVTAYAHALGASGIEVYTNGLLLHQPLLNQLLPYNPRFCFSVYSHDASVHDGITRLPGSLERTVVAIRRVQEAGLEVRVGIALMQANADTLPATLAWLQNEYNIPAHYIRIDPINEAGRGVDVAAAENVRIEHATAPHTPDMENGKEQRLGKLSIGANGDVSPCIFSRDIVLGNIEESSLSHIIYGLSENSPALPSHERWQACKKRLSCHDCRIIAYHLGA